MHVVWLKRDLRLRDHGPLVEASKRGPVLVLWVYEPDVLRGPDGSGAHVRFQNQSLAELDGKLRERGAHVTYRVGRMPDVLEELARTIPITALYSHRETGNMATYRRDVAVADWAHERGVPWHEFSQNGVIRRLKSRDGWSARWLERMSAPLLPEPEHLVPVVGVSPEGPRSPEELGVAYAGPPEGQTGGEAEAHRVLRSFLVERGQSYRTAMSSPVEGWDGCSRISPHLAWGTISMRYVHQATVRRYHDLTGSRGADATAWRQSLVSFGARLRWHCHFMQKLETEPRLEFDNMARIYDGLREAEFDDQRFAAWCAGRTGYPMVDACMRALHRTGWINFRMRAMLVSFASYHLWLHWREPALHLARLFVDYEPGIHFSQVQMQSGVTGINAVRIYSPTKQALDQDPDGTFIRAHVPELRGVPAGFLAEPWKMPHDVQVHAGCIIGRDYPRPIVDHAAAVAHAKKRLFAVRRTVAAREEAQAVFATHGSRRGPRRRPSPHSRYPKTWPKRFAWT